MHETKQAQQIKAIPNANMSLHIHVSSLLPIIYTLELLKQIVYQIQMGKQPDFCLIDLSGTENEPQ